MNTNQTDVKVLSRENFISMLKAAAETKSSRFLRQAAMHWLAVYPGDLGIQLWLAKGLIAENKLDEGRQILCNLINIDPQFIDAYRVLAGLTNVNACDKVAYQSALFALGEDISNGRDILSWANAIREIQESILKNDLTNSESQMEKILGSDDDPVLVAVYHLILVSKKNELFSTQQLAELYRSRWPECLQFKLILADVLMHQHDETTAMNYLHQSVSIDSLGQVAEKIWGKEHSYSSIWPKNFEVVFDLPIPAEVTNILWGNKLGGGVPLAKNDDSLGNSDISANESENDKVDLETDSQSVVSSRAGLPHIDDDASEPESNRAEFPDFEVGDGALVGNRVELPPTITDGKGKKKFGGRRGKFSREDSSKEELQKLSMHLKKQGLGDSRFPVYVILSSHLNLTKVYGEQTANVVENEITKLAGTFSHRAGWSALVYLPDLPTCTDKYNIKPLDAIDPWKVKLSLADLDKALAKKGQMIGALLIVGGDDVIPFHRLPNPIDDTDSEILSDNPYTTLDVNYFIPEWQIGRFPGEPGPDAGLLLKQLRQSTRYHAFQAKKHPWWPLFMNWINSITMGEEPLTLGQKKAHNFGFTAAVWRRSSLAAFRPIGEGKDLFVCPPVSSTGVDKKKQLSAPMAYYNLHGLIDGAEWYGQKDPFDKKQAPDFPIALSPTDFEKSNSSPKIVFTEACYGGHTVNKFEKESIALKFLSQGTMGIVSSTCVSYGSISTPLIGADLLGNLFWRYLKEGFTTGEALMKAKIDLVHEMNRRQGFLDGEDQKTLISFVLYGDPLVSKKVLSGHSKAIVRESQPAVVKTICDKDGNESELREIYGETIAKAKEILADFLPGLNNAEVHVSRQNTVCNRKDHVCPNNELGKQVQGSKSSNRTVVVFSKELPVMSRKMMQYARLTMDPSGKLIKLSISR
jgi:hypothetical protein